MSSGFGERSIFSYARYNDHEALNWLLQNDEVDIDERDDFGRTCLHICATFGCIESVVVILRKSIGSIMLPDYESGWTPLHRALYFSHFKIALLLIKAGAKLGDELSGDWRTDVSSRRDSVRSLRNWFKWTSGIDHEGNTPLDLLSSSLSRGLGASKITPQCTSVMSFGKSDFPLGIQLPNTGVDVLRPRRIDALQKQSIIHVAASKYHSIALTKSGLIFSWGHGKGGRLGHGDEVTQPQPRCIESLRGHNVVGIATSENHTLAFTAKGDLFSWGSDRYGQLGHGEGAGLGAVSKQSLCMSPHRVRAFAKQVVLGVAAADTHSVCFTDECEVWAWGSNKRGQLGLKSSEVGSLPGGVGVGVAAPKRVNALSSIIDPQPPTSASPRCGDRRRRLRRCEFPLLQLSASVDATLLLCRPHQPQRDGDGLRRWQDRVNEVYQWGHGNFHPTRVHLNSRRPRSLSNGGNGGNSSGNSSGSKSSKIDPKYFSENHKYVHSQVINVVQVAAGRYHNVAISSCGHVYTWGLGADQLGHGAAENRLSAPQLVEGLLPERGGGRATFVSVSNNRTCVVSDKGDLYTWGATDENGVLGLGCGKYQPEPKRVVGIKRAIAVASSSHHTLVLQSATLPTLPLADVFFSPDPTTQQQQQLEESDSAESTDTDNMGDGADDDEEEDSVGTMRTRGQAAPRGVVGMRARRARVSPQQRSSPSSSDSDNDDAHGGVDGRGEGPADGLGDASQGLCVRAVPSLKDLCQRRLAEGVDLKNAVQVLVMAEALASPALVKYCESFITGNLDAILVQCRPSDFDSLIEGSFDFSPPPPQQNQSRCQIADEERGNSGPKQLLEAVEGRERSKSKDLESSAGVLRLMRSIKKKLASIESLEEKMSHLLVAAPSVDGGGVGNKEQQEKVQRKAALQAERRRLEPILKRLQVEEERALVRAQRAQSFSQQKDDIATAVTSSILVDDNQEKEKHEICVVKEGEMMLRKEEPLKVKGAIPPDAASTHNIRNTKKKSKYMSLDQFQQKSQQQSQSAPIPSPDGWAAFVDAAQGSGAVPAGGPQQVQGSTSVNAAATEGAVPSSEGAPTNSAWNGKGGGGGSGGRGSASVRRVDSLRSIAEREREQEASPVHRPWGLGTGRGAAHTTSPSRVPLSAMGPTGRTVLSPPMDSAAMPSSTPPLARVGQQSSTSTSTSRPPSQSEAGVAVNMQMGPKTQKFQTPTKIPTVQSASSVTKASAILSSVGGPGPEATSCGESPSSFSLASFVSKKGPKSSKADVKHKIADEPTGSSAPTASASTATPMVIQKSAWGVATPLLAATPATPESVDRHETSTGGGSVRLSDILAEEQRMEQQRAQRVGARGAGDPSGGDAAWFNLRLQKQERARSMKELMEAQAAEEEARARREEEAARVRVEALEEAARLQLREKEKAKGAERRRKKQQQQQQQVREEKSSNNTNEARTFVETGESVGVGAADGEGRKKQFASNEKVLRKTRKGNKNSPDKMSPKLVDVRCDV